MRLEQLILNFLLKRNIIFKHQDRVKFNVQDFNSSFFFITMVFYIIEWRADSSEVKPLIKPF